MTPRFRIDAPMTPRERLVDYALRAALALIVAGLVLGTVVLALLGMAT